MIVSFSGEGTGEFWKGVEVWVQSNSSKLDRPEGGRVNGVDGKCNGVWVLGVAVVLWVCPF